MSTNEDNHGGIPTRVIHESYVDMLSAMRQYYQAEQQGSDSQRQYAHAQLQQNVLSFFEVLRPYLTKKDGVAKYWEGEIPDYDEEDGTAVLATQTRRLPVDIDDLPDDWKEQDFEWLEGQIKSHYPQLNGNSRIGDIHLEDDAGVLLLLIDQYQAGLKHLDGKYDMTTKSVDRGSSYMRHESQTSTERRNMAIEKLFAAAHALIDASDELNLLVDIEESRSKYLAGGDKSEYPEAYGSAEKPD